MDESCGVPFEKDGKLSSLVDYREPNAFTVTDTYPFLLMY